MELKDKDTGVYVKDLSTFVVKNPSDLMDVFDEGNYFSCDANANLVVDNPVDTNTPGTYVVRYNATDVNGMAGEEVIRTINVISDDLEAPVLVVYDADGNPLADGASVEENFVEGAAWDGLGWEPSWFSEIFAR